MLFLEKQLLQHRSDANECAPMRMPAFSEYTYVCCIVCKCWRVLMKSYLCRFITLQEKIESLLFKAILLFIFLLKDTHTDHNSTAMWSIIIALVIIEYISKKKVHKTAAICKGCYVADFLLNISDLMWPSWYLIDKYSYKIFK